MLEVSCDLFVCLELCCAPVVLFACENNACVGLKDVNTEAEMIERVVRETERRDWSIILAFVIRLFTCLPSCLLREFKGLVLCHYCAVGPHLPACFSITRQIIAT